MIHQMKIEDSLIQDLFGFTILTKLKTNGKTKNILETFNVLSINIPLKMLQYTQTVLISLSELLTEFFKKERVS